MTTTTWDNKDVQDPSDLVVDFDTDVEVQEFQPIPDGVYPVLVEKITIKDTADGTGRRANVQLKVTDGDHKGRVVFDGMNLHNKNRDAQRMGRDQVVSLLTAAGIKGERNLSKLVQREVLAKIKTKPAQNGYEASNQVAINGYRPLGGATAAPPSGPAVTEEKKQPAFMNKKSPDATTAKPPQLSK